MKQVKCPKPMFANEEVAIFSRKEIEDFLRYASDLETVALVFTSNMSMAIAAGKQEAEAEVKVGPKPLSLVEILRLPYGTRLWVKKISKECIGKDGWVIFNLRDNSVCGKTPRYVPALEFTDYPGTWRDLSHTANYLNKHYEVYQERPEE